MGSLTGYKRILTLINIILLIGLIVLYHLGFLTQISVAMFLVICLCVIVFSFYMPSIAFALFVGLLPLEIVNFAPEVFGLALRPYQILGVAAIGGMITAIIFRNDIRNFFSWNVFDTLVTLFMGLSVVSVLWNCVVEDASCRGVVVVSFGILYFVTRFFVHEKNEVITLLSLIISSGVVISMYAVVQNILFSFGLTHMEVMPGRPNATFAEPDWLGVYLVFVLAACIAHLYYSSYHKHLWKFFDIALYLSMFIVTIALVLTVARSAWLGALVIFFIYFIVLIAQKKYKLFARHFVRISSLVIMSVVIVVACNLTSFELGNRAQSVRTGMQEITVSCVSQKSRDTLVQKSFVKHIGELGTYGCRHINLEEIGAEESEGNYVFKIYRDDPNIAVRSGVYVQSAKAIIQKPLVGYGWGNSSVILGDDASGTPLNASNILLETAVSVGMIGMGVLLTIFALIAFSSAKILHRSKSMVDKSVAIFGLLGIVAIIVPNMFNAGLLLGFVWVYFGIVAILREVV